MYRAVATIDAAVHTSAAYTLPTLPVVIYAPDVNDNSAELVIDPDLCIPTQEHGNE